MVRKLVSSKRFAWGLIALGVAGLVVGGVLYFREKNPVIPNGPGVVVSQFPSSIRPSSQDIASYTVPPNDPKYIGIPAISVSEARVIRLGVLKSGAIATPDNIYDTGWYEGSARPGESGAMFIYGHVSSWTADGVFYNLKKLKAGDKVTVTRGDDTTYSYQVVSTKVYQYNNVDMKAVLSPINTKLPGLNLMTCTGQVIKGTSEFNERLVVFTSLVKS